MKISIIMTHWSMNDFRSTTMQISLMSLIETTKHLPVEIIVVDNGNNVSDSTFLLELVQRKLIQYYVRNSENLYFGYARNQGYALSCGDYIVFSDNDIKYENGWLEKGLALLEANPEKKIAFTPLRTDRQHRHEQYWRGELELNGEKFLLNIRAGSNSWLIRRTDFEVVGKFRNHHIAGTKWTDRFVNSGYVMATMENPLASDMGFLRGYNLKMAAVIKKVFADGSELVIND